MTAARRRRGLAVSQATPEMDGYDRCGGLRAAGAVRRQCHGAARRKRLLCLGTQQPARKRPTSHTVLGIKESNSRKWFVSGFIA